ncbi:MAG: outer membrane lipoprotein-sorting protein [Porphyromonadaceae bacterium]|nr:MAG: outer membrane lipoprotein-sorting protein [Porphyromonadaceae bacterium]
MRRILISLVFLPGLLYGQNPSANKILEQIDRNMASKNRVLTATMIVHAQRGERIMELKVWSEGDKKSFTEYLSPARDKGTKMLKLEDQLWMFSPSADRIIQISGHMLRQSVMGSDLSYEDMMDDRKLTDIYDAAVIGPDHIDGQACWVLELRAKTDDAAYYMRKMWIDQERNIPMKEECYAKAGKLLKQTNLSGVKKIDGRWFPTKMTYKDMLKTGAGTEFIINDIQFDATIPESVFSKAALR